MADSKEYPLYALLFGSKKQRQAFENLENKGVWVSIVKGFGPNQLDILQQLFPPPSIHKQAFAPTFSLALPAGIEGQVDMSVRIQVIIDSMVEGNPEHVLLGFVAHSFGQKMRRAGSENDDFGRFLVVIKYNVRERSGEFLLAPSLVEEIRHYYPIMQELPDDLDD